MEALISEPVRGISVLKKYLSQNPTSKSVQ